MGSIQPVFLVTGATGVVGPSVVTRLTQTGHRVRTLSRRLPAPGVIPDNVEVVLGDIADPSVAEHAVEGVAVVVHLAGLLHLVDGCSVTAEDYRRVNVLGTETIVRAAVRAGVRRMVYASTVAVYGASRNEVANEDTPPRPDTIYAQTKLQAEQMVLGARRADGGPLGTALRLGAVYGPRVKGNYLRMLRGLAEGWFVPVGDCRNRRTLVYETDVAAAFVCATEHPNAGGAVLNVSDGELHTVQRIIAAMCLALGRTPPRVRIPVTLARAAAAVSEVSAQVIGLAPPLTRSAVERFRDEVAVDTRRIRDVLGFIPQYGLDVGWRGTVDAMRRDGTLQ